MRSSPLAAVSVSLVVAATTVVVSPASAQQPATSSPVTGVTESTQAVLDLDLANVLDLELLTERATADLGSASSALSTITGVDILSGIIPSLDVAFPTVTAQQPGGAAADQESVSLGNTLGTLVPALGGLGSVLDAGGVADGDLLNLQVGALAETLRSAATGATQLVNLDVLGGVLGIDSVTSALLQGSQSDRASVARAMHIDAIGVLSLGSLLGLLGVPLTDLNLTDLGTLADSLGVVIAGLPEGQTLVGFVQPLLDTLGTLLGDLDALISSLTQPVLDVISGLLGGTPAGDSTVGDITDLTGLVDDLITQITDLLTGLLGDLASTPLIQLNAIDLSAVATAVGTVAGSSADASCSLGSVQIGALPAIDLSAVSAVVGQVGGLLSSLPLGLGDLLQLSICGVNVLGSTATAALESVAMAGNAVESRAAASAIHLGINPGAVLDLTAGTPLADLFGTLGGLGLPELPAIPGVVDLSALLGSGNVLAQGLSLDVGSVTARATYAAALIDLQTPAPAAPTPTASLPTTGGTSTLPFIAAALLLPLALIGRRLAFAKSR